MNIAPWWIAFLVAAVMALADALARPALRVVAGRTGPVGALVLGVALQVLLVELALLVAPDVSATGLGAAVATLLIVALVSAATRWLVGVNDSSYLVADLVRRGESRRRRAGQARSRPGGGSAATGVIVVQVDGLPFPVLQHGIVSAILPTLSRWVRSGSHDVERWWARVPSTTPASQAALLHGTSDGIPAFPVVREGHRPADGSSSNRPRASWPNRPTSTWTRPSA